MKNYSGKTINQYYLVKDLGQGGMVVVYKAFDNALNRDVVVKMVRTEDLEGTKQTDILQRFTPLANSLLCLDHKNIAPILDYGFYEDVPYLVAEYLPGGTLKQRMRKKLSLKAAIQVLSPIADALIYAHIRGVLHQDFKPSNVLFHNQDKRPLLTDLGIASLFADPIFAPELFELGFGTPAYMAPEQWRGLATNQSDVYSVGIVFYEMLTGKIANLTETPLAAAFKQNEGLIPDPTEMVAGLSPEVQHFFYRCLALEPVNRFQTMEEMKRAMEHLADTKDDQPNGQNQTDHAHAVKPDVEQEKHVSKATYQSTLTRKIPEEPKKQSNSQASHAAVKPAQAIASEQSPIQPDFRPSLKPDYIKPGITSRETQAPLPQGLAQQKSAKAKRGLKAFTTRKQIIPQQVLKSSPWVNAFVLGLAIGLIRLIEVLIIESAYFIPHDWISELVGSIIACLMTGLAIYFYFSLTTNVRLCSLGLIGFPLAAIMPKLIEQAIQAQLPYSTWLHDTVMWLLLALAIGLMFHGPEKIRSTEGLTLIGGWTIAGALSGLPLLVISSLNYPTEGLLLYLHGLQGLLLGAILGLTVHISFKEHFNHKKNSSGKLATIFSLACASAFLILYGVDSKMLASAISGLVMTVIIFSGLIWATVQPAPRGNSPQLKVYPGKKSGITNE